MSQRNLLARVTFLAKDSHRYDMSLLEWSIVTIIKGTLCCHLNQSSTNLSWNYIYFATITSCWCSCISTLCDLSSLRILCRSFLFDENDWRLVYHCFLLFSWVLEWTHWVLQSLHFLLIFRGCFINRQHLLDLGKLNIDSLRMLRVCWLHHLFVISFFSAYRLQVLYHWFMVGLDKILSRIIIFTQARCLRKCRKNSLWFTIPFLTFISCLSELIAYDFWTTLLRSIPLYL